MDANHFFGLQEAQKNWWSEEESVNEELRIIIGYGTFILLGAFYKLWKYLGLTPPELGKPDTQINNFHLS